MEPTATAPAVRPGERVDDVIPSMNKAQPLADFTRAIADDLAARLTESGLYAKEARAMVNTWTTSYFQTDGVRVLFVLPQSWTDAFIPMTIIAQAQASRPRDGGPARALDSRARAVWPKTRCVTWPATIRPSDSKPFASCSEQGRYVEPIVRRVLKTTRTTRCGRSAGGCS